MLCFLRFLIVILFVMLSTGLAAADQGMPNTPIVLQADAAWARRDEMTSLQHALALYHQAATQSRLKPHKRALLERLAMGTFLLADNFLPEGSKQKRPMFRRVAQLSDICLRLDERYAREYRDSLKDAISRLDSDYTGCMFFKAAGEGRVAQLKGIFSSLSRKPMIDELMKRVYKVNSAYLFGAPDRFYGAYYSVLPGFLGGSKSKSRKHFQRSLAIAPDFLGTKVLMAEHLLKKGSVEYKKTLTEVVQSNPAAAPLAYVPENKIEQRNAIRLLQAAGGVS